MPNRYGREFRRAICERLVAGERVTKLSRESGVSPATVHLWKRQALIDAGLMPGTKSVEVDELAQAHKTIAELAAEIEAVKAARSMPGVTGSCPGTTEDGRSLVPLGGQCRVDPKELCDWKVVGRSCT